MNTGVFQVVAQNESPMNEVRNLPQYSGDLALRRDDDRNNLKRLH